ncbi:hypothetical protein NPIL_242771, partial [Nephila pilipes]
MSVSHIAPRTNCGSNPQPSGWLYLRPTFVHSLTPTTAAIHHSSIWLHCILKPMGSPCRTPVL